MSAQPKTQSVDDITLSPYVTVKDVAKLIDFAQRTFGASLKGTTRQPDGQIQRAELRIGESMLMVGPPEIDAAVRPHDHARPGTFYVFVPDADSTYGKALAAGASAWAAPHETFYGDRVAAVTDANGNVWWIATRKEALSASEVQARADQRWHKDTSHRVAPVRSGGDTVGELHTLNPYLTVANVTGLMDFAQRTFGAVVTGQIKQPDGLIEHVELRIGDSTLLVGPPQVDARAQPGEQQRPSTFYVTVPDVEEACRKAQACGAQILALPTARFFGDRVAQVQDASGNRWWIATREERLTPGELQQRADEHWQVRSRATARTISQAELIEFIRQHRYAVEATVSEQGTPQAALIGIMVNEQLELFFDSFDSTRKVANLKRDGRIAFAIGGHVIGDARTVQYEGSVDQPTGAELQALKAAYFKVHPDGVRRSKLPGITYFRARPRWVRFTSFNASPPQIVVFEGALLHPDPHVQGAAAAPQYSNVHSLWQASDSSPGE